MKIEWIILAEGFGSASNGAVTAIGVNQNLIVTPNLPVMTKRAIMVHLGADDGSFTDSELGLAVKVLSPSGEVVAAQTSSMKTGAPPWPDLPVTFDVFAEFPMRLAEYGTYVTDVGITAPDGTPAKAQASFYVRAPQ
jgi:hypothetical protein